MVEYCDASVSFERRALSAVGRFVPAYFRCAYNLTEEARDRILCRIPGCYKLLDTAQEFHFEMEPIFSYKARALIEDAQSVLRVVAIT